MSWRPNSRRADPLKDQPKDATIAAKPPETAGLPGGKEPAKAAAPAAQATTAQAPIAKPIPLPEARPKIAPARDTRRHRYYRYR